MKKLTITLALLLAFSFAKAQFLTDNMHWTEIRYNSMVDPDIVYDYKIEGDTTIDEIVYHKVYLNNDFSFCLRETDSNEVFLYRFFEDIEGVKGKEYLLYDFKWERGKKLFYPDYYNFEDESSLIYTIIDKIDSVQLLNGLYYKCLKNENGTIKIIQGIGDLTRFTLDRLSATDGSKYALLCFHKGDQLIYLNPNYEDCSGTAVTSIAPISLENSIKIFPNPTNNCLNIEIDKPYSEVKVEIRDIKGSLLYQKESLENPIQLNGWSAGVYMVKLLVDNKVITKKIMLK
ncbi:MAG: T9SS type A sorting domain-containing protein [Bacteroidales bacterium]|nr:T9SS type A sorting domain-containing protein [Bacteroidales bacterium]